jgi:ABC-type transport system involved in cytochrome c biogenesis permease subunit
MKRTLGLILMIVCLAVSLPLLVWGFWPPRRETVTVPLTVPAGMPSLPEGRMIQLTFSPVMRAGDSQTVNLDVTAEGDRGDGDVYAKYTVIAEARLDLPFADVRPAETVSTALTEGGAASFSWEVTARAAGGLRGTAWLYLRFVPKAGGDEMRGPVSAQLVAIRSRSALERTGLEARVVGVAGLIVGLALGILFARVRRTFLKIHDDYHLKN